MAAAKTESSFINNLAQQTEAEITRLEELIVFLRNFKDVVSFTVDVETAPKKKRKYTKRKTKDKTTRAKSAAGKTPGKRGPGRPRKTEVAVLGKKALVE